MPRAVVDHQAGPRRAPTTPGVLAQAQAAFGEKVLPLYLPVDGQGAVTGLVGLLSQKLFDYSSGSRSEGEPREDVRGLQRGGPRRR